MVDIFVPGVGDDDRDWFQAWQRDSTDGETAVARLEMYYASDVTSEAGLVKAPTLVIHREGDQAVRPERGAELAAAIPGATLELVAGGAHVCFLGDWVQVADLVVPFLNQDRATSLPRGPFGQLTARELDVAELTVLGLSNAEIGGRLGISSRTVETHMTRIRQKLGVGTRAEVAAWMARRTEIS